MRPRVIAVVAVARNGCIGNDNKLPWHLPEDLRRFKALTLNKCVVMGRKTYDSILSQLGRPLPSRFHLVLTRNTDWAPLAEHAPQVQGVQSFEEALWVGELRGESDLMLIGGADVYAQALAMTDVIELTEVAADVAGDAFFPALNPAEWSTEALGEGAAGAMRYRFVRLTRIKSGAA